VDSNDVTADLAHVLYTKEEIQEKINELAARIDADPTRAHMTDVVRVRSVVERGCVQTLDLVARALGPGPMCMDPAHARRWSDLTVFIRQSHADRDWQQLGMDCHREGQGWTL
jgi:hypoxanthine-guanine phosphoribosyltransferase